MAGFVAIPFWSYVVLVNGMTPVVVVLAAGVGLLTIAITLLIVRRRASSGKPKLG
jgi:hypothetical protein